MMMGGYFRWKGYDLLSLVFPEIVPRGFQVLRF
jgi:hypothetical protein